MAEDYLAALKAWYTRLGWVELGRVLKAVQLAHRLYNAARHVIGTEAKTEITDLAAYILVHRGEGVAEVDLGLAEAMLGQSVKSSTIGAKGTTSPTSASAGTRQMIPSDTPVTSDDGVTLPLATWGSQLQPGGKVVCYCPVHHDKTPSAVIRITNSGRVFVWCSASACGVSYWAGGSPAIGPLEEEEIGDLTDLESKAQQDLDSQLADIVQLNGDPPPLSPEERAALEAERAVQTAAERAESDARMNAFEQAMAPYKARVEARKAAGKQIPRAVAEGAWKACQAIKAKSPNHPERHGWATAVRRHWEAMGLDRAHYHGCGHYQVVTAPYTGRHVLVRRRCGKLTCYVCGPQRVALAAAAMAYVPLHSSTHGKGSALATMGAYVYEITRDKVDSWRKAVQRGYLFQPVYVRFHKVRAKMSLNPLNIYIGRDNMYSGFRDKYSATVGYLFLNRQIKSLAPDGAAHNVHGWTVFEPPLQKRGRPPRVLAISTYPLNPRWGIPRYLAPEDVPSFLLQATLDTYRYRPAHGLRGVGNVVGRARTSRTITVDVETIRSAAAGSDYTVTVPRANAAAVAADPDWQEYTATTTTDPHSGDLSARATREVRDAQVAGRLWAAARTPPQPGKVSSKTLPAARAPAVKPLPPEVEAALDDLLEE